MPSLEIRIALPDHWSATQATILAARLAGELPSELEPRIFIEGEEAASSV